MKTSSDIYVQVPTNMSDDPRVLKLATVKAPRKKRPCVWCGETIEGEAVYRVSVYNGFETDYWHTECHFATEWKEDFSFDPGGQTRGVYDPDTVMPPDW